MSYRSNHRPEVYFRWLLNSPTPLAALYVMAVVRPPPHKLNPPSTNETSTDNAEEQLVLLEKPEKELERLHQLPPLRREIYRILVLAKFALVLTFAIFYLTFCFIVHYRHVPIGQNGVLFLYCEQ
jgi:hypothetical protein